MKKVVPFILSSLAVCLFAFTSCLSTDGGVYADVIGFNDDVTPRYKPYNLSKSTKQADQLKAVILDNSERRGLPIGQNTAEVYAMDIALDRIRERIVQTEGTAASRRFYIILLTDGLDNISVEMAKKNNRGEFSTIEEYKDAVHARMGTILNTQKMFGLLSGENQKDTFQSFPIMLKGEDAESFSDDELRELLSSLAGAQNADVPTPILPENTDEIMKFFKEEFKITSFNFTIPKGYSSKKIKMRLSQTSAFSESESSAWFTADFVREEESKLFGMKKKVIFKLENIEFSDGFSFDIPQNAIIYSDISDPTSNLAYFSINNLKTTDASGKITKYAAKSAEQSYEYSGKFRKNTEYNEKNSKRWDAYILFVLDTSSSLGDKEKAVRQKAFEIIDYVGKQILNED